MALYNLSEFITTIKEDIGIKDLPLPVTDQEIVDRFKRSTLVDFSILYPRKEICMVSEDDMTKRAKESMCSYYEYRIPKYIYEGSTILSISHFDVAIPNG